MHELKVAIFLVLGVVWIWAVAHVTNRPDYPESAKNVVLLGGMAVLVALAILWNL